MNPSGYRVPVCNCQCSVPACPVCAGYPQVWVNRINLKGSGRSTSSTSNSSNINPPTATVTTTVCVSNSLVVPQATLTISACPIGSVPSMLAPTSTSPILTTTLTVLSPSMDSGSKSTWVTVFETVYGNPPTSETPSPVCHAVPTTVTALVTVYGMCGHEQTGSNGNIIINLAQNQYGAAEQQPTAAIPSSLVRSTSTEIATAIAPTVTVNVAGYTSSPTPVVVVVPGRHDHAALSSLYCSALRHQRAHMVRRDVGIIPQGDHNGWKQMTPARSVCRAASLDPESVVRSGVSHIDAPGGPLKEGGLSSGLHHLCSLDADISQLQSQILPPRLSSSVSSIAMLDNRIPSMASNDERYTMSPCPFSTETPNSTPFEPPPATMSTISKAPRAKRSEIPILANDEQPQQQPELLNPVVPPNGPNPILEPTLTTKLVTFSALSEPLSTVPVVVTPHPQGPHGVNNIHYDAENAATPENPVGTRQGASNQPSDTYNPPDPLKWFTIGICSAVVALLVAFIVYRKVKRRREIRRQLRETGEIQEVGWDE